MKNLLNKLVLITGMSILLFYPGSKTYCDEYKQYDLASEPVQGFQELIFENGIIVPAESEDEYLIGNIIDVRLNGSGNICIVDYDLKNVKIFDKDLVWKKTIGGQGEGPGECSDARRLFFDENGNYGLLQAYPPKIVWLKENGDPLYKITYGAESGEAGGFFSVAWAKQNGNGPIYGWLGKSTIKGKELEEEKWIRELKADGKYGDALYVGPKEKSSLEASEIDEGNVYQIWKSRWLTDSQGGLWIAPFRDKYLLRYYRDGEITHQLRRKYKPIIRTDEEKECIAEKFGHGWEPNQVTPGKTAPVIESLRMGDDGNIWVRLDQGNCDKRKDVLSIYDVVSPDGIWLKQLTLKSTFPEIADWYLLDDTTLMLMHSEDGEEAFLAMQKGEFSIN